MRVALALALAVVVVAVGLQLAHETVRAAAFNGFEPRGFVVNTKGPQNVCQHRETLHAGTASLRVTIGTFDRPGPPVDVQWLKDGRVLARGRLDGGWSGGVVRIPLDEPPSTTTGDASVCFQADAARGRLAWGGEETSYEIGVTVDGTPFGARLSIVSELSGSRSLFSMFGRAADRYPAGNAAWLGPWAWWVIILLAGGAVAAAGVALVRSEEATARLVPAAGWLCALAGLLACTAWALLIPPFHVPDENAHAAYVQSVVESGELPLESDSPEYSEQERGLLEGLDFYRVIGRPLARPLWTSEQEAGLRERENTSMSHEVPHAGTASANPPLFYLLQAPVYWATPSTRLLDKLLPMRLLSALFGALTVLAIFLFLRELMPGAPWLWPVGSLVVAFHPGFGFISAGVNPDALLFTLAATCFWLIARILRRGATVKRAAALGAVVAAGVLTKPLFLGLLPAAGIALLIAALRGRRPTPSARRVLVVIGATLALAAVPVLLYDVVGRIGFDHPYFAEGRTVEGTVGASAGSLREEIDYVWELWLPRLPDSYDHFPNNFPLRDIWVDRFVGEFGWLDYGFPRRVQEWAERFALVLLAGVLISLYLNRRRMRGRWLELGVYATAAAGIAVVIGSQDYSSNKGGGLRFTQVRYVFPLLALYAGLIAVALRAVPRRAGWYGGVALVTIAAVHELSAMLLTVGRYYV